MDILVMLLASYGLCFAIRAGHVWALTDILATMGYFRRMFGCAFCTGTHTGWITYLAATVWEPRWSLLYETPLFALASATFCLFAAAVEEKYL